MSSLPRAQRIVAFSGSHNDYLFLSDVNLTMFSLHCQVITTHEDKIKSAESAAQLTDLDDEKMREIGKSNIDKWLNVLLNQECPRLSLDGAEHSAGRLDTHHSPLSPAMSTLSMDALRGSEELGEGRTDVSYQVYLFLFNFYDA